MIKFKPELLKFASEATDYFNNNPNVVHFTADEYPFYFAIRWGMTDHSVLIMELSHVFSESKVLLDVLTNKYIDKDTLERTKMELVKYFVKDQAERIVDDISKNNV